MEKKLIHELKSRESELRMEKAELHRQLDHHDEGKLADLRELKQM